MYFMFTGSKQGFCAAIDGFIQCLQPDLKADDVHPYERQALKAHLQFLMNLHDEQCQQEGMFC